VKFDWYTLHKLCLVSTICIREYSNVWTSFQTVQYWMCEMHWISAVFTSFWTYDFGCKISAENGGNFPSHLDRSQKHIEICRIRGFDFGLSLKVKFDWYTLHKPCLVTQIRNREYSNVWTSFQSVRYWMCEMHRISAFFTSYECMTLVCKIRSENGDIFPPHPDGS
jgi:hypothetical protein